MSSVCGSINQLTIDSRNDEQVALYYQLGFLLDQREFAVEARTYVRSLFLTTWLNNLWQLTRRVFQLYSTRGTWNIFGTNNISCYVLRYMRESDFQELMEEATSSRISEVLIEIPDSWDFAGAQV